MKTIKQLDRLRKIHALIKNNKTGTHKEFALLLEMSESQLYKILDSLKIKGLPIFYSKEKKSYIYNKECNLKIRYSVELLTEDIKINIVEGNKYLSTIL
ncbi:MAG: hypothetical protein HRT66_13880 [Flavobacteriaceae bacterium]|nr:hypothetical protein [Flavobacteriaceae bacterium]